MEDESLHLATLVPACLGGYGKAWYGMVGYGMVSYGTIWYGTVVGETKIFRSRPGVCGQPGPDLDPVFFLMDPDPDCSTKTDT